MNIIFRANSFFGLINLYKVDTKNGVSGHENSFSQTLCFNNHVVCNINDVDIDAIIKSCSVNIYTYIYTSPRFLDANWMSKQNPFRKNLSKMKCLQATRGTMLSTTSKLTVFHHVCPSGISKYKNPWWCHQMETFSVLLALCAGNSPVTGEFPSQRPVTRSFDVSFDLRLTFVRLVIWDAIVPIMTSL